MRTMKKISLVVHKPYDYQPISKKEKQRVYRILSKEVLSVANRFDGPSTIEILISAKGNI